MKKLLFDIFKNPDDETADRLSVYLHSPHSETDRVFAMTEKRLKDMKEQNKAQNNGIINYKATSAKGRMLSIRVVAAFAVFAAAGIGIFALKNVPEPAFQDESITDSSLETADISSSEAQTSALENKELKSENENSSKVESSFDNENASKVKNSSKKAHESDKLAENQENLSVITGESSEPVSFEQTNSQEAEKESGNVNEVIDDVQTDNISKQDIEVVSAITSSSLQEKDWDYKRGYTGAVRILQVTPDMTYREVIELLGEPETYGQQGYAQYIVDEHRLLMMIYDDENDNIGIDGEDLLAQAVELSELYSDRESRTFDGFIIKTNDNGNAFFVVCPQYYYFDCAYVYVKKDLLSDFEMIDWLPPLEVRITHADAWEDSYPIGVDAESIDLYK